MKRGKREKLKMAVCALIICALSCGITAFATNASRTITVDYCDIQVYKDDVLCKLKDSNGTTVEPFIYNGTTYIPLRAAANLAGLGVDWDGRTHSIYLWDDLVPGDTLLVDACLPYQSNNCTTYLSGEGKSFKMAGEDYTDGFTFYANNASALFNLNGKYSAITFVLGKEDTQGFAQNSKGKISFIVDGKTVKTVDIIPGELPEKIIVPLDYGLQMKIVATSDAFWEPTICMGNVIVE